MFAAAVVVAVARPSICCSFVSYGGEARAVRLLQVSCLCGMHSAVLMCDHYACCCVFAWILWMFSVYLRSTPVLFLSTWVWLTTLLSSSNWLTDQGRIMSFFSMTCFVSFVLLWSCNVRFACAPHCISCLFWVTTSYGGVLSMRHSKDQDTNLRAHCCALGDCVFGTRHNLCFDSRRWTHADCER